MAQQINLFNPIFLQQKKHFSAVTMLQALGLLLAGMLAFYAYATFETGKLTRVADASRKQLQAQGEQLANYMRDYSPQGRSKALEQELARATAQLRQREDLFATLRTPDHGRRLDHRHDHRRRRSRTPAGRQGPAS
jgi:hypothetical protein